MASPRIDVRRAPKRQGRWWVITINDKEVYREVTAKEARRFARNAHKIPGLGNGVYHLYNPEYVGLQPATVAPLEWTCWDFLCEPEPLGT